MASAIPLQEALLYNIEMVHLGALFLLQLLQAGEGSGQKLKDD